MLLEPVASVDEDGDDVDKFVLCIELSEVLLNFVDEFDEDDDDIECIAFNRLLLLPPELDDTVHVDDVFIPLANDGAVKCNCELVGVDGCDARRGKTFANKTGPPSATFCVCAVGVLECE